MPDGQAPASPDARAFATSSGSERLVWRIEAGERQVNVLDFIEIASAAGIPADEQIRRVLKR